MSDVLLQASIQLIDSTRCNAEDAYQGEVTSEMVCAGTPQGGVDACQVSPPKTLGSSVSRNGGPEEMWKPTNWMPT